VSRIRQSISDLSVSTSVVQAEIDLLDISRYFARQGDQSILKEAIELAYDVRITSVNAGTADQRIEMYQHGGIGEKLSRGEIDAIPMGWGHKVVAAKATLFNEPGSKFSLVMSDDEEADTSDVMEVLSQHRDKGGFKRVVNAADCVSVSTGSCGVFVHYRRGSLRYQKLVPGMIRAYWGDSIIEDGRERPVDQTDIEDASLVLLRLGHVDAIGNEFSYIGIIPSCDEYPYGRYVTFTDQLYINEIPKIGTEGVIDYVIESEDEGAPGIVANPLSWYAVTHPEEDVPEIPIAVIMGGTTEADCLMPTTDTLFRQSLIFDKKSSHILNKVEEKAVGTLAISRTPEANGMPLPMSLTGAVTLQQGQSIEDIAHDASACEIAHAILRADKIDAAAAYSVPDFMVVSEDHTLDASSGRALDIKARPLKKDRESRIELNRPFVQRIFEIERSYLAFKGEEDESIVDMLMRCSQRWEAGELTLPQNKKENAERIIALGKEGIMDPIAQIREYYQLPSDEDAMDLYEVMAERRRAFPPLNQAEQDAETGMEPTE
jgi:hypothetical protein